LTLSPSFVVDNYLQIFPKEVIASVEYGGGEARVLISVESPIAPGIN
jgi:hypothetical protein